MFSGHTERVDVAVDGRLQLGRRISLYPTQAGRRQSCLVPSQHRLQYLSRSGRHGRLQPHDAVGIAVADDLDVGVVGEPAAGHHRVQLLAAFRPGEHSVRSVDRRALRTVDRGRVVELDVGPDVLGGQGDLEAARVRHSQAQVASHTGHRPAVAVAHPPGR